MDFWASLSQSWPGPISLPKLRIEGRLQARIIDSTLRNSYNRTVNLG